MIKPKPTTKSADLLREAVAERDQARKNAEHYKRVYESQQKYNKTISDNLRHSERLVRTLLDALADKYHPIPTNIKLSMDCRVAAPRSSDESSVNSER